MIRIVMRVLLGLYRKRGGELGRRGLMREASHDSNEVRLPEAALDGCRTMALSRGRFEPDPGGDRGDVVSR